MGNFEKLSVLVIVVIIVMILVVALYTWQDTGDATTGQADRSNLPGTPLNVVPDPERVTRTPDEEQPWPESFEVPVVPPLPPEPRNPEDPIVDDDPEPGSDIDAPEVVGNSGDQPGGGGTSDVSRTETWTYVIKSGDTLSQISERELGTYKRQGEIKQLNEGVDWLRIRPGQPIKMPARGAVITPDETASAGGNSSPRENAAAAGRPGTITRGEYYVSVAGDTIQSISKRAYGTVERWPGLWARNLSAVPNIDDPLKPGTRIFIPN